MLQPMGGGTAFENAVVTAGRLPLIGPPLCAVMLAFARTTLVAIIGSHLSIGRHDRAIRAARILNAYFRPAIRARTQPATTAYVSVLWRGQLTDRISLEFPSFEDLDSYMLNVTVGYSLLQGLHHQRARRYISKAIEIYPGSYQDHRYLGRCSLLEGDVEQAQEHFLQSVKINSRTLMGHQNYAGRYDVGTYVPEEWEFADAGRLLVYDNLMQMAEDQFLRGNAAASMHLYQRALEWQNQIGLDFSLPDSLLNEIEIATFPLDRSRPVRLLSYEWVTQFGHIGLIDCQLKMSALGLRPPFNYVLLAPPEKVANPAFVSMWKNLVHVIEDPELVNELFPYQRLIGENFIALPSSSGELAEPWTRRAARAQIAWAGRSPAGMLNLTPEHQLLCRRTLRRMGLPDDAWYVGLHVREGGFYGDHEGTGGGHRNSRVEHYFDAIEGVIRRGGYVIRLGDPSMTRLPRMPNVIDYAHSPMKSPAVDLFLLASARFIIGTTSGLTTAALAFGTPMLLVNCISNDWQMWSSNTHFILKPVVDRRTGEMLSLSRTYRDPLQSRFIDARLVQRMGYDILANTREEITEAVRFKLDLMDGKPLSRDDELLLERYRLELGDRADLFGAATPVPGFLRRNPQLLEAPGAEPLRVAAG